MKCVARASGPGIPSAFSGSGCYKDDRIPKPETLNLNPRPRP